MMRHATVAKHAKWLYDYILRQLGAGQEFPPAIELQLRLPFNLSEDDFDRIIVGMMDHLGSEQADPRYGRSNREKLTVKKHSTLTQLEWFQHLYLAALDKEARASEAYNLVACSFKGETRQNFINMVFDPVSISVKILALFQEQVALDNATVAQQK